mgnify:CR=1 FL=1
MFKKTIIIFLYSLIFILITAVYLTYFGIETKRFNQAIKEKVSENNNKIKVELNKVKIVLNPVNFTIAIKTKNPDIIVENRKINLKKISANLFLGPLLKKEFSIKNAKISTKENNLKEILDVARIIQNSPQLFIIDKMIKAGRVSADIDFNFDDKGKLVKNYNIKGSIKDGKIRLLNKKNISKINLNFDIEDNKYLLENLKIEYEKVKISSKKIKINNKDDFFLFEGNFSSSKGSNNSNLLTLILKNDLKNLGIDKLNFTSNNNFSFKLSKKIKVSNLKINSTIDLHNLIYKKNNDFLKKYISNYDNNIELIDHQIELYADKKKLDVKGNGKFLIDKNFDKISYEVKSNKDRYNFKSQIELNNLPLKINLFNYTKKGKSSLNFEGFYEKNKNFYLKEIYLKDEKNIFKIKGLSLNKDHKINFIEEVSLNFLNDNKKKNKILLQKNKKNYELSGKIFDGTYLLNELLNSKNEGNPFDILNKFDSIVKINLTQVFIDDINYLNNLNGILTFKKSNLKTADLKAYFFKNRKLTFTIKTNQNDEKITTLFSEYAKPLVQRYKFIKGFEEGIIDFQSVKKQNISNSQLKIYDFKLKEVPALTKILTLASLQGIADLLTGEGIRFNEFDMKFKNENKVMTIQEVYAIGPAISVLMDGYLQSDELISLRGTLVPATTLNKVVGSIPFLGNILVGKKVGEGVFGVSFKIKGYPKDLKTTVNPIKTLTPRFITRTLEKIKNAN